MMFDSRPWGIQRESNMKFETGRGDRYTRRESLGSRDAASSFESMRIIIVFQTKISKERSLPYCPWFLLVFL